MRNLRRSDLDSATVQVVSPIVKQIVVGGYGLVSRYDRIDIEERQCFADSISGGKQLPARADNLTPPRERVRCTPLPFHSDTVTGDRENTVLQTAGDHGILTIREDQIRGMADDVCAPQHQSTS